MSIEKKIKTAKEDSWLKDSVSEKEFKEIKDNERKMTKEEITKAINKCQYRHTGMGEEYAICSLCCESCIEAVNRGKCKTLKKLFENKEKEE